MSNKTHTINAIKQQASKKSKTRAKETASRKKRTRPRNSKDRHNSCKLINQGKAKPKQNRKQRQKNHHGRSKTKLRTQHNIHKQKAITKHRKNSKKERLFYAICIHITYFINCSWSYNLFLWLWSFETNN